MVLAVVEGHADVDHRVAAEVALLERLDHALLDRRDERARNGAAHHLVDELEAAAARQGLDPQPAVGVLAAAAALLLVLALGLGLPRDRLVVGHVRRGEVHRDAEAALDAAGHDLDVHLREPRQDQVAGLLVVVQLEGGVLVDHPPQRGVELVLVGLVAGRHGEAHQRRGEVDRRELDRGLPGDEHIAGHDLLELGDCTDVARADLLDRHVLLALEREELAHPLLGRGARARGVAVARQHAREDAHQGDAPAELVGERLEAERHGRALGARAGGGGRGQRLDDQVERAVDADAGATGGADDGRQAPLGHAATAGRRSARRW